MDGTLRRATRRITRQGKQQEDNTPGPTMRRTTYRAGEGNNKENAPGPCADNKEDNTLGLTMTTRRTILWGW